MKEATGEVSMTIITLVAIAVIGGILAANWGRVSSFISNLWDPANSGNEAQCKATGGTWNANKGSCDH